MKKLKSKNGITLIALVVTIMVLIILAGVSLSAGIGDTGVIKEARNVENKAVISEEEDFVDTAYSLALDSSLGAEVTAEQMEKELDSIAGEGKANVTDNKNGTLTIKFTETEHEYKVAGGKKEVELTDDYGHSYIVTKAGKYYFYSYTSGQNFMTMYEVTEENGLLVANKLGEYSNETGRSIEAASAVGDMEWLMKSSEQFSGAICLSFETELETTRLVGPLGLGGWYAVTYFYLTDGMYYWKDTTGSGEYYGMTVKNGSLDGPYIASECDFAFDDAINLHDLAYESTMK